MLLDQVDDVSTGQDVPQIDPACLSWIKAKLQLVRRWCFSDELSVLGTCPHLVLTLAGRGVPLCSLAAGP